MKRNYLFFIVTILFCLFISCNSTNQIVEKEAPINEVNEDDVVEADNDEYLRSINNLSDKESISMSEFTDDKAAILEIINNLSKIMEEQDFESWTKYITPESLKYYSNPANIKRAQQKLPDKTIVLYRIDDYFKYVFIPSRKRSKVEEIRYISKTEVKAVEVKSDKTAIVYYSFTKQNGKWLINLPTV